MLAVTQPSVSYKRHRFLPEIIAHAVWLYFRFPLSLRLVEEMLLERGVVVSYETVRCWAMKFGAGYVIRFPVDYLALAISGHPWKPPWPLTFSRSLESAAQRAEIIVSRISMVAMYLLTTGSSTSVHSVSAGCTSGV